MPKFLLLVCSLSLWLSAEAQTNKEQQKTPLETAEEVLAANIEATGGQSAWEAIRTLQISGTQVADSPSGGFPGSNQKVTSTFVEMIKYPGYAHKMSDMDSAMGSMTVTQVRTPTQSWVEAPQIGKRDAPHARNIEYEGPSVELTLLTQNEHSLSDLTIGTYHNEDVYVVSHVLDGVILKRYYSQESLLLIGAEEAAPDGEAPIVIEYSDYREVEGLLFPFRENREVLMRMITRDALGNESESTERGEAVVTIQNIIINPVVDDSLFASE